MSQGAPPHRLTGTLEGMAWPPVFAAHAPLAALVEHLEATQWLAPDALAALQGEQLALLVAHHARSYVPLQAALAGAGLLPGDFADIKLLRNLPILSRADLQGMSKGTLPTDIPPAHLPVFETQSSGSTGEPVAVRKTQISMLLWSALTVRLHRWSEADRFGRLAVIRADAPAQSELPHWSAPVSHLHETGPLCFVPLNASLAEQAASLAAFKPDSLLAYPGNVAALIRTEAGRAALASVRSIKTFSETVSPELRAEIEDATGARLHDSYSTQEVGYVALQCPDGPRYHVMAESLIVEIVDEAGEACAPGQEGRVLVTDLSNLATPVIRYALGDHAIAGDPCPCGRGLPVIERILGRSRGMMTTADGARQWPIALFRRYREITPVTQYQMIQHAVGRFELRLATPEPLTPDQKLRLTDLLASEMRDARCDIRCFADRLPPGPGGKTDEFISLIGE